MSLSPQFLDELRARTVLSSLIGAAIKVEKAGREHKACCPFHNEKTPSFTINDEKGFYHCFGCGAHGDAIRWMTDHGGLPFMDAVKELAAKAGLDVPPPSPEAATRESQVATVSETLTRAADWYGAKLRESKSVTAMLADRGVDDDAIARFGLGYAPKTALVSSGIGMDALRAADLMIEADGRERGLWRERFRHRLMIPIHDARGRAIGFGARLIGEQGERSGPKYINSPDSGHFDKGRLLYNLHRAAPAARAARRLIIVEGYFDVIALDSAGISEVVAPMGTAMTEAQLERAWRVIETPILCLDGDEAGRKAALRACERAMPLLGPGRSLRVALLPAGMDPDDVVRTLGREGVDVVLEEAAALADFVFSAVLEAGDGETPEGRSAIWKRLSALAGAVRDEEMRGQYLSAWRGRFDTAFPPAPLWLKEEMLPDGRVEALSEQPEVVQARLRRVAAAWLDDRCEGVKREAKALLGLAFAAGLRVGAGLLDENGVKDLLWPHYDGVADVTHEAFDKALADGIKRQRGVGDMLLDMRCAMLPFTDMGNAERFRERFGRDFFYTTAKGWLGWDGKRWKVLDQEKDSTPAEVMAAVFETVRGIQGEARFVERTGFADALETEPGGMNRLIILSKNKETTFAEKIRQWGRASESAGKLGCIANLAKRWLSVQLTDFDTNPMILNCHNGTLHFIRPEGDAGGHVELQPHRREDMLTKMAACDYDAEARAPEFQKLVRWAQPKPERRRYLRQWAGYNLTGEMGEQIFHIWWGPTAANGKSTVGNALREAVGDYGDITNVETFLDEGNKKRGDQATPDIVRLPGVRFLTSGEPAKGAKINEALINSVTGGDPMLARDNFRSFFRFSPSFKWTLWCNAKPDIPMGTEGIWRRVKVLLWESHLEPHERDRTLGDRLKGEYPGILAWMVRGLIDWMDHGFIEPEDVRQQSEAYRDDSDPLASFLRLCTVEEPDARVQSSHLYDLFCAWCKAAGETEWKQKGFSRAMKDRGFSNKQSNGMQWLGLKMVKAVHDFVDHEGKVVAGAGMGAGPALASAMPDDRPPIEEDDYVPPFD